MWYLVKPQKLRRCKKCWSVLNVEVFSMMSLPAGVAMATPWRSCAFAVIALPSSSLPTNTQVPELMKHTKSADCGQPIFLCILPIDFWSEMWYNNRGVEVRPTMVEIAGILKKSSISQFFPSIFAFPNICSVSRNYVNRSFVRTPFLRSGRLEQPHMRLQTNERAAQGWGGPSSDRLTPYGKFFYWKWSHICPDKIPKSPIWPISMCKADRLIIILSHYNYNIFFNKSQATGARLPDR